MKTVNKIFFLCAIFIAHVELCNSQIYKNEKPTSNNYSKVLKTTIPEIVMPLVNVDSLLLADSLSQINDTLKIFRFGVSLETDITFENNGQWELLPDSNRIWRIKIIATGAYFTNLIFEKYWLPEGARLFIYNNLDTLGAYSNANNKTYTKFAIGPVIGDNFTIEYFEPKNVDTLGQIKIIKIIYAYKNILKSFGSSGNCNSNVNCPLGDEWDDQKRAVAMILTNTYFRICTGCLVNQVVGADELQPYFLTAKHCVDDEDVNTWIFMFNYQSPNCNNINGPTYYTVSGSSLKAKKGTSDFALLQLDERPSPHYNVYYAGWSRGGIYNWPSSGTCIHHPRGDIKKISFEYNTLTSTSRFGIPFFPSSFWKVDDWDIGTTEPGSSGSPLFDHGKRVVGQLLGGYAACGNNKSDWFGEFGWSWNYGNSSDERLKDWLDPYDTDIGYMDGTNPCYNDIVLQNITINPANLFQPNNEMTIRATNNIIAAGNNTNVTIQSGSNVTFVAGNEITLLPGFSTELGAEFHAYIESSNCSSPTGQKMAHTLDSSSVNDSIHEKEINTSMLDNSSNENTFINIFPNPTSNYMVVQYQNTEQSVTSIYITKLDGQIVEYYMEKKSQPQGYNQYVLHLGKLVQGKYLLTIERNNKKETKKIIKTE